jgi:hypothetical protein
MSQQLNLLVHKRSGPRYALLVPAALGVMLALLLGVWATERQETARAQAAEAASARQLQAAKAALQVRQQQLGSHGAADALAAEIAALKPRAEASQELLALVQKGDLGSQQGYARYFSGLATIAEDGLWLTGVTVNNAGKTVSVTGHALRNESVMHYAQRLNVQFADYGVQLTAVELTPETFGKPGDSAHQFTDVAFKLQ